MQSFFAKFFDYSQINLLIEAINVKLIFQQLYDELFNFLFYDRWEFIYNIWLNIY